MYGPTLYLHGYHGAVPPMAPLRCMHGWLGPRTGPRPPRRARDINYGASPHAARDPPIGAAVGNLAYIHPAAQNRRFVPHMSSGYFGIFFRGRATFWRLVHL